MMHGNTKLKNVSSLTNVTRQMFMRLDSSANLKLKLG